MNTTWFEDSQKQWQDWQNQWVDAWKNSIPNIKDMPDISEVYGKALDAQEEAVKATLKIQQDAIEMTTDLQKKWLDTYFDSMRQMSLATSK
jgi:hypothetical protein